MQALQFLRDGINHLFCHFCRFLPVCHIRPVGLCRLICSCICIYICIYCRFLCLYSPFLCKRKHSRTVQFLKDHRPHHRIRDPAVLQIFRHRRIIPELSCQNPANHIIMDDLRIQKSPVHIQNNRAQHRSPFHITTKAKMTHLFYKGLCFKSYCCKIREVFLHFPAHILNKDAAGLIKIQPDSLFP